MIFKLMPSTPIAWPDVWIGAAVTAVLFEVGKVLIGLYLGKSSVSESFAAAGSLVVLLAWVYYAAQIFLLGAEFTKVYANAQGSVAASRAQAATEAAAEQARMGTDGAAARQPGTEKLEAVEKMENAQRALEVRTRKATAKLLQQAIGLFAISVTTTLLARRRKQRRRHAARMQREIRRTG